MGSPIIDYSTCHGDGKIGAYRQSLECSSTSALNIKKWLIDRNFFGTMPQGIKIQSAKIFHIFHRLSKLFAPLSFKPSKEIAISHLSLSLFLTLSRILSLTLSLLHSVTLYNPHSHTLTYIYTHIMQGSKGIRQWSTNLCTTPMMIHIPLL